MAIARHRVIRSFLWAILALCLPFAALADVADTVTWAVPPQNVAGSGGKLTLTLTGAVQDGWHVYSLRQLPDGPTPLLVGLDANDVAAADGAVAESPPIKFHDPAFDLQTQFYQHAFAIKVPVRLKPHLKSGTHVIPVNVRFQTCNGRICEPPKTVHLSATISLKADE